MTSRRSTIAVTGATGFVGGSVLDEAQTRGLHIRALTRRPQDERPGVTWVGGDLFDTDALATLVQDADAVLHIAGVVNAAEPEGFTKGNVEGTKTVVAAARAAGVDRFVAVSSLAAREPSLSLYGKSKRLAEEIVQTSVLDWVIVRPPAIYGPRDMEMLDLFRAAKWRIVPMPPAGRTSIIHAADLSRLLLDLCEAGPGADATAHHRIFEPDDGRDGGWQHKELARAIGRAVGKAVLAPSLPASLLRIAARGDRLLRGARAKLTPDRARYMAWPDWVVSRDRMVPHTLWQPRIPTQEGLNGVAEWYRLQGYL